MSSSEMFPLSFFFSFFSSYLSCSVKKAKKAKKYYMESSVKFSSSAESTSISMPSQKPEPEIPNSCTVKENDYAEGSDFSLEVTNL